MGTQAQDFPARKALDRAMLAAQELLDVTGQQGSQIQLRNGFVARPEGLAVVPVATQLLRHSNKGGLQLRLALVFFWLAGSRIDGAVGGPPYTVRLPVRALTTLMSLDDQSPADRRRIRENASALARAGLIEVERVGSDLTVSMRRDLPEGLRDSQLPYWRPGVAHAARDRRLDAYFTLPSSFVTDGWLTTLTTSGLVVLLAFRYLSQTRATAGQGLFISERLREERFGFSERSYYSGSVELAESGLARSWAQHVRGTAADAPIKVRRVFALRPGLFDGWAMSQPSGAWPNPLGPAASW